MQGNRRAGAAVLFFSLLDLAVFALALTRGKFYGITSQRGEDLPTTAMIISLLLVTWLAPHIVARRRAKGRSTHSYWAIVGRRFAHNSKGLVGGGIIVFVAYLALFSPVFSPCSPLKMNLLDTLQPPSGVHPLGTDNFGRDIASRIVYGARVALGVGAAATLFNMVLGGLLGLIGGFFKGPVDNVIMRLLETVNGIPLIVLAILVISVFGSGTLNLVLVLGIFGLGPARIIRSKVLAIREEGYIEAARAIGTGNLRILLQHVLPNAVAPLLVVTTMMIGANIITVAGLSFLGLGIHPPTPSWGGMLQEAQEYMRVAWWMPVFPGLAIIITVFGFNILGDALRDVLDPKLL